jgi:hypothetical protein
MTTRRRQLILMPDALRLLSVELGSDSSEPVLELSIASAQLESHGAKLDRIIRRLSLGKSQPLSENSGTGPTG